MSNTSRRAVGYVLRQLFLLGGAWLLSCHPVWAQTLTAPPTLIANTDGSFQYAATFTAGPDGEQIAAIEIDGSDNTDIPSVIIDYSCSFNLAAGAQDVLPMSGTLLNLTSPGRVTIRYATTCPEGSGRDFLVATTILPAPVSPLAMAQALETSILDLAPQDWGPGRKPAAFLQKAQQVTSFVASGSPCDLSIALNKLAHDMLPKTDGLRAPEDWIITTNGQQTVQARITALMDRLAPLATCRRARRR